MKTLRRIGYIIAIGALVGGIAFACRSEKARSLVSSFNKERDDYKAHHKPTPDWYYSVESVSTTGNKTFIIGLNMQPVIKNVKGGGITITLEQNESVKLQEIEVPTKKIGLKEGAVFFTVKTVDGTPTLVLFPSEQEVIKSMIRARNTPAGM